MWAVWVLGEHAETVTGFLTSSIATEWACSNIEGIWRVVQCVDHTAWSIDLGGEEEDKEDDEADFQELSNLIYINGRRVFKGV